MVPGVPKPGKWPGRNGAEFGPADGGRAETCCPRRPVAESAEVWPRNSGGEPERSSHITSREPQLLPRMESHLVRNVCSEEPGKPRVMVVVRRRQGCDGCHIGLWISGNGNIR